VRGPSLGALWFGLLVPPLAWSAQELVGYGLAARACVSGRRHLLAIAPGLGMAELIVSGAALVLAVIAVITAGLSWRRSDPDRSAAVRASLGTAGERSRFMAMAGMLLGMLFLLAILMNAGGYFLVSPCP
jgi:hypothetical protein